MNVFILFELFPALAKAFRVNVSVSVSGEDDVSSMKALMPISSACTSKHLNAHVNSILLGGLYSTPAAGLNTVEDVVSSLTVLMGTSNRNMWCYTAGKSELCALLNLLISKFSSFMFPFSFEQVHHTWN